MLEKAKRSERSDRGTIAESVKRARRALLSEYTKADAQAIEGLLIDLRHLAYSRGVNFFELERASLGKFLHESPLDSVEAAEAFYNR
jgi:hypothetical protein